MSDHLHRLAGAALCVALLLAVSCRSDERPDSRTAAPEPTLVVRGDRLFIPTRINGVATEALLDSGAELTLIDAAYASRIGLTSSGGETARGTGGEQQASFAENVTIEAAGIVLESRTVAVLDLSDIATRLIAAPLDVVVGRELFDAARLEIDIERGSIRAVDRAPAPPGVALTMQTERGLQTVPVTIEGAGPVQADFDLGNGSEVLIGAAFAARSGLATPARIVGRQTGGGIGGPIERDLVLLATLEVAGTTFYDVPAAIDPTATASDANIGVRILRNFVVTVDFSENTVWLEPR